MDTVSGSGGMAAACSMLQMNGDEGWSGIVTSFRVMVLTRFCLS